MRQVTIYSLIDPRDNVIKYIGKTVKTIEQRLSQHVFQWKRDKGRHNKLNSWIKSLAKLELKPIIEVIDICDESNWKEYERGYIALMKSCGAPLKNQTIGGDQIPENINSPEAKEKRLKTLTTSEAWKKGHTMRSLDMLTSTLIRKIYEYGDKNAIDEFYTKNKFDK